jgi:hypothetical protein
MPLPITIQDFAGHVDSANAFVLAARDETNSERAQVLATCAVALAQLAQAEATWIGNSSPQQRIVRQQ